ncbi:hypothetical protein ENSA5_65410 [Enhygromyxa salina]|uniref:Uncharacterized protein n=1 Tax=Enhygromyxa salina TaxID=215803 RepID=A0A2S9XBV0_9BACT|nr:hypothetical protein [Enhygromyxa salina]PRP90344.1 hypothetical protein ENSA5_65410 [Enhygromyxa salina]
MLAHTGLLATTAICACLPPPPEVLTPAASVSGSEISSERCVRYAGEARDPSLLGTPWAGEARCCESDFGFDPELAVRSCGLREYLGESEELACVHRFAGPEGEVHELRLTPVIGREFEAVIALHESGEFDDTHVAGPPPEHPSLWISSAGERHWALVPGWDAARRLSWTDAACSPADMLPALAGMLDAPDPSEALTPLPRIGEPETTGLEVPPDSLLARYADADTTQPGPYPLPHRAASLIARTLHAAATEDRDAFSKLVARDARWGLPDRRQLASRPIRADDEAAAVMAMLRRSAARMSGQLELHCPDIDRRVVPAVRRGEAPMWCVWASEDLLDLIVFGVRGRVVDGGADGQIEYIGVFPDRPARALVTPGEPPPPPIRPQPEILCGDPHAVDYPELCPPSDSDESGSDQSGSDQGGSAAK